MKNCWKETSFFKIPSLGTYPTPNLFKQKYRSAISLLENICNLSFKLDIL